jgi:putative ABC transport system permease protein
VTRLLERLLGRLPIGWLQLTHNPPRLAAALAGVAFANVLVFMQLGFLGALTGSIRLPYAALNADVLIVSSDANTLQDGSPVPRARMLAALGVPGVAGATALHYGKFDWKQADGTIRTLDVFGTDPRERAFRSAEIDAWRPVLAVSNTAVVDRGTRNVPASLWQSIDAGETYRIEASARWLDLVGTFRMGGGFGADGYAIVSDQTFLKLFRNRSERAPNLILVRAAPDVAPAELATRLRGAIAAPDITIRTIDEAVTSDIRFQTTQRPVGIVFGFGVVIGALVGLVIVYQVLVTEVADHLSEYATFKAMGYRHPFFLGIVLEESTILAVLGFLPGVAIAVGLYAAITAMTGLPLVMTPLRAGLVLGGTILLCTLSGALATRRLARADPAELF